MAASSLNVGLIGLGTVGSQVAERMLTWQSQLARRAGIELCLRRVLVRDVNKRRTVAVPAELLTADAEELLDDPTIHILVEVAGGDEPMHSYLEKAIRSGKHVVTANKVVMARHGPELLDLAADRNVDVYFEAAVGGGIPLISMFRTDLQANRIERVSAVINGTTNYVLGRMATAGLALDDAVREAQAAGFAEADPTDDVGGFDATYKLAILGSIAYEIKIRPDDVFREGIEGIQPVDFRYARELGYGSSSSPTRSGIPGGWRRESTRPWFRSTIRSPRSRAPTTPCSSKVTSWARCCWSARARAVGRRPRPWSAT